MLRKLGYESDVVCNGVEAVQAAAEKANWQSRTAPRKQKTANGNYVGQGMAYAFRSGTIVAIL